MTENGGAAWQPTDGRRPSGERDPGVVETNVFTSIWNHRMLVLGSVLVFAVLGLLLTALKTSEYAAEAGLVLRNPESQSLLDTPSGDELRYVADQVAILKSVAVADRASALLKKAGEVPFDAREIQRRTTIGSNADSNYILVRFAAATPKTASAGANAIVRAYRELIREDVTKNANASLQRLDAAIADTNDEALLSELRTRRTRILVNSKLAGDGVGLFSPAGLGKAQGVSWLSALAIAVVLGGLVGAGLAYWLDARKQAFSNWLEPEALLRVPAIAEIPDFTRERVTSKLPVLHSPGTESAEAFRLLASSVSPPREAMKKAGRAGSRQRDESGRFVPLGSEFRSVAFVAGAFGDGTTTLTANTAFAAAQDGYRVLALDTDVEQQGLTRLLLGRAIAVDGADSTAEGLSNMLRHRASPETIQRVMGTGAGGTLSLLGPGTATRRRGDVFRAEQILSTLDSMRDQFDLVLIDVPPILQIAYADALLRSAGTVVAVVRHRSEAAQLKSVSDRLVLLGAHPVGYVYNFAPSRQEAGRSVTKGVLGRAESVVDRTRAKKPVAP
ncbi:MAG TPA: AAA family ATPase [Gaiellaceae bacterium]|nr:AAA family ATPase [Gaiellaceae bacterium]